MDDPIIKQMLEQSINRRFDSDSKAVRVEKFRTDYAGFCAYYFNEPPTEWQTQINDDLLTFDWVYLAAPPGHGKTQNVGYKKLIHLICYDRNVRIAYVTKEMSRAKETVKRIAYQLEFNEKLVADYGEFRDINSSWGVDGGYYVIRDNKNIKEPTIIPRGLGGVLENWRGDVAVLDDVIDIKSMVSNAERKNAILWFDTTLFQRMDPGSKIWAIGHLWHPEDLYHHLMGLEGFESRVYKAVLEWGTHPENKDPYPLKVLSPELMNADDLYIRARALGKTMFDLTYQNNVYARTGNLFDPEWLEDVRYDSVPGTHNKYQAWDFAYTSKDFDRQSHEPDFTACVTIAKSAKYPRLFYIEDIWAEQISAGYKEMIVHQYNKHRPLKVSLETNAAQRWIKQIIGRQEWERIPFYPVVNTTDKVTRLLRLQPLFQTGRIRISTEIDPNMYDIFVGQYLDFSSPIRSKVDILDALEMAIRLAEKDYNQGNTNEFGMVGVSNFGGRGGQESAIQKSVRDRMRIV